MLGPQYISCSPQNNVSNVKGRVDTQTISLILVVAGKLVNLRFVNCFESTDKSIEKWNIGFH